MKHRCRCGIRPNMTWPTLREIAARGSCTSPHFMCPELDKALRVAEKRYLAQVRKASA